MTIYTGPVFEMARQQFAVIADYLEIPQDERDRLLYPKRAITVACPIHADDGRTLVYEGYRVQHHLTLGPTKGGTRFSPKLDIGEVAALAIWMSWKCGLTGLPYGGAKGGVAVDPYSISKRELEGVSRRYMQEMIPFVGPHIDVMAPDMGTNEQVMAWFMDTYSMYQGKTVTEIVTGKPVASGGTEEAGGNQTRRRLSGRAGVAADRGLTRGRDSDRPRRRNVGSVAAATLAERGLKILGVSDHTACYFDPRGLPVDALLAHAARHGVLRGFSNQLALDPADLMAQKCDVLVPAALERVIDAKQAARLQCRVLAEGANGPTTPEADEVLNQRRDEIFVLPDILCNAGGVVVSYFEWLQDLQQFFWDEAEVMSKLYHVLDRAFAQVMARADRDKVPHRTAAMAIGVAKVRSAKNTRGLFP
jgi:glutamate dehydrogenase (NAD(P)+)